MLIKEINEYYAISLWLKGFSRQTISRGLKLPTYKINRLIKHKQREDQRSFLFHLPNIKINSKL